MAIFCGAAKNSLRGTLEANAKNLVFRPDYRRQNAIKMEKGDDQTGSQVLS
jgi:hypothetical protein